MSHRLGGRWPVSGGNILATRARPALRKYMTGGAYPNLETLEGLCILPALEHFQRPVHATALPEYVSPSGTMIQPGAIFHSGPTVWLASFPTFMKCQTSLDLHNSIQAQVCALAWFQARRHSKAKDNVMRVIHVEIKATWRKARAHPSSTLFDLYDIPKIAPRIDGLCEALTRGDNDRNVAECPLFGGCRFHGADCV